MKTLKKKESSLRENGGNSIEKLKKMFWKLIYSFQNMDCTHMGNVGLIVTKDS
jgi:hypothetical protein